MALNFPNSPTNGQLYTDSASGNRWTWDSGNTCWVSTSTFTQTITVASSAPGSPVAGQLWWNKDYGRLLVYYTDNDTSQWVDASPSDYTSQLAYNQSNTVYGVANAAFGKANNALANTSGVTFAGDLNITGNTTSFGRTVTSLISFNTNTSLPLADAAIYRPADGTLALVSNAVERMRINSSGYIIMPYQPVFAAVGGTTQSWSGAAAYQTLQLSSQTISTNSRASGYNTSTYRFTAPVAGMYMFFAKITQTTSATGPALNLFVNGGGVAYEMTINYGGSGYVSYSSASGMIPYYMNVGDYAEVKAINYNNVSMTLDLSRCNFVGWLLG